MVAMGPGESCYRKGSCRNRNVLCKLVATTANHGLCHPWCREGWWSMNLFQPKSHTGLQRGLAQKGSVLCIPQPETKPSAIPEWVLQKASNPKLMVPFLQKTHFIIKTQGRNHNFSLTPSELQHMWEMSQWLISPHPSPVVSSHTVNASTVPPPHAASFATLKSRLIHFNLETHWSTKPQFLTSLSSAQGSLLLSSIYSKRVTPFSTSSVYPWAQTAIPPLVYLRNSFTDCNFSVSTLWDENGLGQTWPEPISPEPAQWLVWANKKISTLKIHQALLMESSFHVMEGLGLTGT